MCRLIVVPLVLVLALAHAALAVDCTYLAWSQYGSTKLLRRADAGTYAFRVDRVGVDADGAPNAYHPDDVGLNCAHGTGFKGLDCPANAGYPSATWWPSVLVADPADTKHAYVQPPSSDFAGFFVAQTSLRDEASHKADTDPTKYVDARTVPYLVFPGKFHSMKGTGGLGDVGYAFDLSNGKRSPFVVAEVGPPSDPLGEVSIALAEALGGTEPNPRNGAGVPPVPIVYVVFPRSRLSPAWPLTADQIRSRADELLAQAGGAEGVLACRDAF